VTISIAELDEMPASAAARVLTDCCGSARWVAAMLTRRPFKSRGTLLAAAEGIWQSLDASDWVEAFAAHPRIGERSGSSSRGERAGAWAAGEQSAVERADRDVRNALEAVNYEYEARFGYIYIVCATGRTAEEMLGLARERLSNDPEDELKVAAGEQEKITRLRLEKLLDKGEPS
jgi:2-oxo-4-hydroxy-4-carboxy-5-ureidoimidazoline decarboxylase